MSKRNHDVPDELLSSLLANYKKPEDLIGENGLLKRKLPRQADTSKIELPAWVVRYSAGLSPPSESCGRISL